MIKFTLPIKTENEQNLSRPGNFFAVAGKRKKKRNLAQVVTKAHFPVSGFAALVVVRMTRVSAGELDDDGLRAALKSIRDGIADGMRIDDGSRLIRFDYAQRKGERGKPEVEVEIFFGSPAHPLPEAA